MTLRQKTTNLWAAVGAWILFCVVSLRTNWLGVFFYDTYAAHVQGIDFFPVPRAALNLLHRRSQFDTFHSDFGPYATWYLYHPVFALFYGPLVAGFSPWHAYGVSTAISIVLLAVSSSLLMRLTQEPLQRALIVLLLMGSFPGFIMLFSGNVQAIIILSLTLILVAVEELTRHGSTRRTERFLFIGLLLSLFSKPFVLAMLPLLLLLKETRRATLQALAVYLPVSFLTLAIPGLNPVALSWTQRWDLLTHIDVVKRTMNIYANHMNVTLPMQDNSIHWLNIAGLSDFRFPHIDVLSLSQFVDSLLHTTSPAAIYRIPLIVVLEMTILIALVRDRAHRLEAALLTLMATSLLLFVSYGLVWEYYYAAVMPLVVLILLRSRRGWLDSTLLVCGGLTWLPSLFVFVRHQDPASLTTQTIIRAERILPVTVMFVLLLVRAGSLALSSPAGLRYLSPRQQPVPTEPAA